MRTAVLFLLALFLSTALFTFSAQAGEGKPDETSCRLIYSMSGWSFIYKTSNGTGTITCTNGESAEVSLKARGGGLSVGKSNIIDGRGKFSEVTGISELYGGYAAAEAHAGATKSAAAQAMTKGEVSLSLRGTGQGFDLGVAFGSFRIEPK
jgi:hypothetical protein